MATIGLGILSWRGEDILAESLRTYAAAGLFDLFDRTMIFLPEPSDRGIELAHRFGVEQAVHPENLGILGGFKALAERLETDFLVLCENDYCLVEPRTEVERQLAIARKHLEAGIADYYNLRHRERPGPGLNARKVGAYWPAPDATLGERVAASIRRLARPGKARRMIGPSLFMRAEPPTSAWRENMIQQTPEGSLIISSRGLNWWNGTNFVRRSFYLRTIVSEAEKRVTGRGFRGGFPTIESELNCSWWRNHNFRIGIGRGLFSHRPWSRLKKGPFVVSQDVIPTPLS